MDVLYGIGSLDLFRNLKVILSIISIIISVSAILKLKRIISNYNYINREVSMLENLKKLSYKEFISWLEDFLSNRGYFNLTLLEDKFYIASNAGKKSLVFIDREISILDEFEGKYILGYLYANNFDEVVVITTGKIHKSFYNIISRNNLKYKFFSKNNFECSYKEFIFDEF